MKKTVTEEEKKQFFFFWKTQYNAIKDLVSARTLAMFNAYTEKNNVGYDLGELRPGKLGQWDLYNWLTDPENHCDKNEALIASCLSASEVAEEERRQQCHEDGVDPDSKREIVAFERLKGMSPEQLEIEIANLEKQIFGDSKATV